MFHRIRLIERTNKAILLQFRHRDVSRAEYAATNSQLVDAMSGQW
jgi:hypothetical protein